MEAIDKLKRLKVNGWNPDRDSKYCLIKVMGIDVGLDRELDEHRQDLINARTEKVGKSAIKSTCNLPGCSVAISEDFELAKRTRAGECRAASYCLKDAFEAVGQAPTTEAGRELYRKLMNTCEGFASKYSAGNFCPRLDCDLSAGVSVDMVPGTAGECLEDQMPPRLPFELDQV